MPLQLEKLTAARLLGLSREKTVFFLPVGPFEDHGPHLPIGLDLIEAEKLARMLAEKVEREMPGWTAVLFPSAALGIDTNTSALTTRVRAHVLRDYLVDSSRGLARAGFRKFVAVSTNLGPRQLTAIEEAGKSLRRQVAGRAPLRWFRRRSAADPALVSAGSALVAKADIWPSMLWPDPKEHGGKRDTSVALHVAPDAVDSNYVSFPEKHPEYLKLLRGWRRWRHQLSGYWGRPSDGNATQGKLLLLEETDKIYSRLRLVLEGGNPDQSFRSWYSLFPPNQSFFKAWVLLTLLVIVLGAWLMLTIQSMSLSP